MFFTRAYNESGEQESRQQHVHAEFEFSCGECQTTLRALPADRRDYYDEVQVLEAERRTALRDQLRQLCRRAEQRLWAPKPWSVLILCAVVAAVIWL